MKFIVYGLIDPRDGKLFYVGKSWSGLSKAKRHNQTWSLSDKNKEKCDFIRSIQEAGHDGAIVAVLEVCRNRRDVDMRERVLIAKLRKEFHLLNKVGNRKTK